MHEIHPHISQQQAVGRGHTWVGWDNDVLHTEPVGQITGVERSGSTERDQGVAARVAPAFHGDGPNTGSDVFNGDAQNAFCRRDRIEFEARGKFGHNLGRLIEIQGDAPPGNGRRDASQHQIGVRHRRLAAAPAIAGRSRIRARAVRAHFQTPPASQPGNRPAARPNRMQLDHGRFEIIDIDLSLGQHARLAAFDQANISRGATHVKSNNILVAAQRAKMGGGNHPCGWAGKGRGNRQTGDLLGLGQSAARTHDVKWRADVPLAQVLFNPGVIRGQEGHQGSVQAGCIGPFVLAVFAQDVRRDGNKAVRIYLVNNTADFFLVLRITVGVQ